MSDKKQTIMDAIESMTVLELSELVKALEEKFGRQGRRSDGCHGRHARRCRSGRGKDQL